MHCLASIFYIRNNTGATSIGQEMGKAYWLLDMVCYNSGVFPALCSGLCELCLSLATSYCKHLKLFIRCKNIGGCYLANVSCYLDIDRPTYYRHCVIGTDQDNLQRCFIAT